MDNQDIKKINEEYKEKPVEDLLKLVVDEFGDGLTFASSLGAEDQVITALLSKIQGNPDVFVLDTGRLNQETYDVIQKTEARYGIKYRIFFPDATAVEEMVNEKGPNLFYESVENRKRCCHIRKVAPLKRALSGYHAWMTGIRRAQSMARQSVQLIEWDETHEMIKINPLVAWTRRDVWDLIKKEQIPYNALHDLGYASIGCAPCTRAIKTGEDERAGRWWWEDETQKECGLHVAEEKEN